MRLIAWWRFVLSATPGIALVLGAISAGASEQRPFTERDAIEMTVPGDVSYSAMGWSKASVAKFSPDGRWFVIVVRRGEIPTNDNRYALLLWSARGVRGELARPRTLAVMRSTSNRPGIDDVSWAPDSRSIRFLGENPGQQHQLYEVEISSAIPVRRTTAKFGVLSYAMTADRKVLAYLGVHGPESLWTERAIRDGIIIPQGVVPLPSLLLGLRTVGPSVHREETIGTDLYIRTGHRIRNVHLGRAVPVILNGRGEDKLSLSPNGRYLVIATEVPLKDVPDAWHGYRDAILQGVLESAIRRDPRLAAFGDGRFPDSSQLQSYQIVDTRNGDSRLLLNSPISVSHGADRGIVWSPDSKSVVISAVFLPIGGSDDTVGALDSPQTVEIGVKTGSVAVVRGCSRALVYESRARLLCTDLPDEQSQWFDRYAERVEAEGPGARSQATAHDDDLKQPQLVRLEKYRSVWKLDGPDAKERRLPEVFVREDMNNPPTLWVRQGGAAPRILYDFNPKFALLHLNRVEDIHWESEPGHTETGGLYYPANYQSGVKFPLVIQTHGWSSDRFWPEGFSSTGYAAQALASNGFFVLQLNDSYSTGRYSGDAAFKEIETARRIYISAVDYLARRQLINRTRVGVISFSQTSYYLPWVLTQSPRLFAAASMAESSAGGYVADLSRLRLGGDIRSMYGGPPEGASLRTWVEKAPTFNLDHVRTPLRIIVANPYYLNYEWELFEGLNILNRPVEMTMLYNAEHVLVKPGERLTVSNGNVDWFRFWLKDEEDPDPAKAGQYERWRQLRSRQMALSSDQNQ